MSEIDSMNNLIDSYINEINNLQEQLQQLKAENEELDQECQEQFNTIMKLEDEIKLIEKNTDKYSDCIDEIEEIIKGFSCCEWFGNCECCELSDDKNPCLNEILQLIKQAKEGNNENR